MLGFRLPIRKIILCFYATREYIKEQAKLDAALFSQLECSSEQLMMTYFAFNFFPKGDEIYDTPDDAKEQLAAMNSAQDLQHFSNHSNGM